MENEQTDSAEQKPAEEPAKEPANEPETQPETVSRAEFEATQAELKRLQDEKKERDDAELSEMEREKKRADEAEGKIQTKEATIRRLSILQGVRDAAAAQKLDLDFEAVKDLYAAGNFNDIKVDDNGDAIGLGEHLKQLLKTKGYIVKTAPVTKAPDINAGKKGEEIPGEMTDERRANLEKRFRLRR